MRKLCTCALALVFITIFLPEKGFTQLLSWDFEAEVRLILDDDFDTLENAGLIVGTRIKGSFGYDDGIDVSFAGAFDTVWDRSSATPTWFETDLGFITRSTWETEWVHVLRFSDTDQAEMSSYNFVVYVRF